MPNVISLVIPAEDVLQAKKLGLNMSRIARDAIEKEIDEQKKHREEKP